MKRTCLFLAIALVGAVTLAAQSGQGMANAAPQSKHILDYIVEPSSVVYSKTFSEYDVEWQQWAYSLATANHPLFDTADCSVGQGGPVWFLGGKFCANTDTNCSVSNVQRTCTIPKGKMIYFPVSNGEDSALEQQIAENGTEATEQIASLRAEQNPWGNPPTNQYAIIDGVTVPNLQDYYVTSTTFSFTIPYDNYLKAVYPSGHNDFVAGTYFPAVDSGTYLMLKPLPPGKHVIKFGALFGTWGFNITYNLTVQ